MDVQRSVVPEVKDSETVLPKGSNPPKGPIDNGIDVPYTDYEKTHQKPYSVEYFNLGGLWDDPQGGYGKEVSLIEEYFTNRIENGDLDNNINAVKKELKELEKTNNLKDESRISVKLGTLSAYVRFLMETDHIRYNARKYGSRFYTNKT